MGKFNKYWPMREGGPYDDGEEVFKCAKCGGVSYPDEGWNGEPETHTCSAKCQDADAKRKIRKVTDSYRRTLEKVFPHAPGVGI